MTRDRMQRQRFELKYVVDEVAALGIPAPLRRNTVKVLPPSGTLNSATAQLPRFDASRIRSGRNRRLRYSPHPQQGLPAPCTSNFQ